MVEHFLQFSKVGSGRIINLSPGGGALDVLLGGITRFLSEQVGDQHN